MIYYSTNCKVLASIQFRVQQMPATKLNLTQWDWCLVQTLEPDCLVPTHAVPHFSFLVIPLTTIPLHTRNWQQSLLLMLHDGYVSYLLYTKLLGKC